MAYSLRARRSERQENQKGCGESLQPFYFFGAHERIKYP